MLKIIILGSVVIIVLIATIALCQIAGDEFELPCGQTCEECKEKSSCPFSKIKQEGDQNDAKY